MTDAPSTEANLREQLAAAEQMNDLLVEEAQSMLELAAEDKEWRLTGVQIEEEFSRTGLAAVQRNCTVMSVASPMVKRGIQLRTGYVWGQGVSVQARASGKDEERDGQQVTTQDVNAIVQAFWDDEGNQRAFTSAQAQEQNEHTVATAGNWFVAFFTDPVTGFVQVRRVPFAEIADKYTNPDDRDTDWYFLREYSETVIERGTQPGTLRRRKQTRRVLHPALGFRPAARPKVIDNIPVDWDVPILHVTVNRPEGWKWGVPDVYAALPWARAYEGFLTDWARLVKALSKFAWKLTGDKGDKVQRAASKIAAGLQLPADVPPVGGGLNASNAGGVAASGPGVNLEAIPKSGATIDSDSGRPLAAMVAAAMGVSVVSLLSDPGVTGARAVAETLDKPEVLEMGMRQAVWRSVIQTIIGYVIDQAVLAPSGPLQGTAVRDDYRGRVVVQLADDTDRGVEVVFPALDELDPIQLVTAIAAAEGTNTLPPVWVAKALLRALGEQDVDEVLDPFIDDDGNWIGGMQSAGDEAVRKFRQGEDPASDL